jgi:hypothetical protein
MGRIGRLATWLVGPILVVFLALLAIYGTEGPPDNARVNAGARLIGVLYALYAVVAIVIWRKSGAS